MPRQKLTEDQWVQVLGAYSAWDPSEPGAPTITELVAPWGITKQTLYNQLRRRGIQLKAGTTAAAPTADPSEVAALKVLLELLVEARSRVVMLEAELRRQGHGVP